MAEQEQDRSEQPTSFKLARAREKGTVARGHDLGFLVGLATACGFFWISGSSFGGLLGHVMRSAFLGGPQLADGNAALLSVVAMLFSELAPSVIFFAGAVFLAVLLFEIVQTGFVFSAEPLRPDFSRLNPATGLKRLFTLRLLLETAKNILKFAVYLAIGYLVIRGALQADVGLVSDGQSLSSVLLRVVQRLLACFVLGALLFAVLDQVIARRDFFRRMRMSRREVRRELRDREGDPRLKQKRKQLHREFTKTSQSLRNIKKADLLITNPEHIAIGLQYDAKTMAAPTLIAVGTNRLAQRLKRLAFVYGIPVIEDRGLARELYRRTKLDDEIPAHCYQPVATLYNQIRRVRELKDQDHD